MSEHVDTKRLIQIVLRQIIPQADEISHIRGFCVSCGDVLHFIVHLHAERQKQQRMDAPQTYEEMLARIAATDPTGKDTPAVIEARREAFVNAPYQGLRDGCIGIERAIEIARSMLGEENRHPPTPEELAHIWEDDGCRICHDEVAFFTCGRLLDRSTQNTLV